jgi:hypothetical protein
MNQLLKVIGATAPLAYAAAVYGLFLFLERNASPAAKRTIAGWIKKEPYTSEYVANITVYVFDRLFSYPLLGWRPIVRTALMSLILASIIVYTNYSMMFFIYAHVPEMRPQWTYHLAKNMFSDYCSLFVVRQWLLVGARRPLLALMTGPLVGALVVCAVYLILDVSRFSVFYSGTFRWRYFLEDIFQYVEFFQDRTANSKLTIPAFIIHLWLPLFAAGILVAQGINSLRWATMDTMVFEERRKAAFSSNWLSGCCYRLRVGCAFSILLCLRDLASARLRSTARQHRARRAAATI